MLALVRRLTWILPLFWLVAFLGGSPVRAQSIESVLSPGALIAGHAKQEGECAQCHERFNPRGQDALCMACHKEVQQDVKRRQGFHGRIKGQPLCRSCHTDHKGRKAIIVHLDTKTFDHKLTDYLLKGKHVKAKCQSCHTSGKKYWEASTVCATCHQKDDVHKGGIDGKCADCHNESDWRDANYDHNTQTKFALKGKHVKVKCDDCHANGRYKNTPMGCVDCHKKDDEHKGRFGAKCESCHRDTAWKEIAFNHDVDTDYPLRGKHKRVECSACHTGVLYRQKLPQQCWDCHQKDDVHKTSLGRDCASCHSESDWKDPPRFDHGKTRFPLLGKHDKVACKDCHKSDVYKDAPMDCYACHKKDDKHEGTLGKACGDCHQERDWKTTAGRFDHDRTQFPLRNAHAAKKVACSDCHTKGLIGFKDTPLTCYACHSKDDQHKGSLGRECKQCHTDLNWKVAAFDHDKTKFPLTGAHRISKCDDCHKSKQYKDVGHTCTDCHRKDDAHKGALGVKCESCHSTRHWQAWRFNHDSQTKYALTGKHVDVACEQCHTQAAPLGAAIAPVGDNCVNCHRRHDVHDGQLGPLCEQCHTTAAWAILKGI